MVINVWLVFWNIFFIFGYIGNVIIPTDFNSIIFQVETSKQNIKNHLKTGAFRSFETSSLFTFGIPAKKVV
jgi:hypothetical protein